MNEPTDAARALPIKMDADHDGSIATWAGRLAVAGARAVELRDWDGGEVSLELAGEALSLADDAVRSATVWFYGARRVELRDSGDDFLASPDAVTKVSIDETERAGKWAVSVGFRSGASLVFTATHGVARVSLADE